MYHLDSLAWTNLLHIVTANIFEIAKPNWYRDPIAPLKLTGDISIMNISGIPELIPTFTPVKKHPAIKN